MRSKLAALLASAVLAACGGGGGGGGPRICEGASTTPEFTDPDYAPNFVGPYWGTGRFFVDSDVGVLVDEWVAGEVSVSRTSANKLQFHGGLDPIQGLVVGADSADLVCLTDSDGTSCGRVTVEYVNGVADLVDGDLVVDADITGEACGYEVYGYMEVTAIPAGASRLDPVSEDGLQQNLTDLVAQAIAARLSR